MILERSVFSTPGHFLPQIAAGRVRYVPCPEPHICINAHADYAYRDNADGCDQCCVLMAMLIMRIGGSAPFAVVEHLRDPLASRPEKQVNLWNLSVVQ